MTRVVILAALLALTAAGMPSAGSRLQMDVTPTLAYADARLWVTTRIEPADEHREIEVIAESETFYRSSAITLDGARAPRRNVFEFSGMPAGDYDIRAVLKGQDGSELAVSEAKLTLFETGR